ncbi:phage major capsid protein [Xanthobacter sp. DSM 24535]|uniref:phage major capsid protein n=1 Tax=Roseixanthobacter psychrophilus TaxID=3119917 RepID=UPI003726FCB8
MLHVAQAPLGAIEFKGEGDDPAAVVTQALEAFKGEVIGRLERVEAAQSATSGTPEPETKALGDRLDKIEAKLNRPGVVSADNLGSSTPEQKAFDTFLRRGEALVPELERKALVVANDTAAGYLVAPEPLAAEILKKVELLSPVRQFARGGPLLRRHHPSQGDRGADGRLGGGDRGSSGDDRRLWSADHQRS